MDNVIKGNSSAISGITPDKMSFKELSFIKNNLSNREEILLNEKVKKMLEEAEKKGFENGYKIGLEDGNTKISEIAEKFNRFIKQIEEDLNNLKNKAERDIIELSIKISEKIISKELSNKESLIEFIKENLKEYTNLKNIKVILNNEDYNELLNYKEKIVDLFDILEPSQEIEKGRILIKYKNFIKDVGFIQQLDYLKSDLLNDGEI
jgi:flagellar assembly protein FliH